MKLRSIFLAIAVSLLIAACGGGGGSIIPTKSMQATAPSYNTDDLYQFFAVAFGAAPGVTYMGQLLDAANAGMSIKEIVNVFTTKEQFTSVYPLTLTNAEFATRLSANVIGISATDQAKQNAVNDIIQALAAPGWTRGDVIFAVFNNLANKSPTDQEWGGTATKMKNQVLFAKYYTEVMKGDTTTVETLQRIIRSVTENSDTTTGLEEAILASINPPFSSTPLLLPDLRAKYDSLCGNDVGVQSAIAVNLSAHHDGKKDLIFTLWCAMRPYGQTSTAPTKNGLVAFLQQSDGTFIDGTKKLFGVELLDIGGVGSSPVAYDFNNDGYDDVVYPVSGEDGRALPVGYSGNNRQNFFITSKGDGTYSTTQLGSPSYGFSGKLIDNQYNSKDVLLSTIGYGGAEQAWRFVSGMWNAVNDYDLLGSYIGLFFGATAPNQGADKAIITKSSTSIDLYSKSTSNKWSLASKWAFPDVRTADINTWNGDPGKISVVGINGTDYTFIYFGEGCEIKRKPSANSISIFALPASEIVGGFNGQLLVESSSQLKWHLILQGFSVDSNILTKVDIPINNEITDQPFFGLRCGDLNSDGFDDIMVMPWGRGVSPIIYLNNGYGNFQAVNQKAFPLTSGEFTDVTMIYADIDGDGILDLIYWPLNGLNNNPPKVQYQIFKGIRKLGVSDLK